MAGRIRPRNRQAWWLHHHLAALQGAHACARPRRRGRRAIPRARRAEIPGQRRRAVALEARWGGPLPRAEGPRRRELRLAPSGGRAHGKRCPPPRRPRADILPGLAFCPDRKYLPERAGDKHKGDSLTDSG